MRCMPRPSKLCSSSPMAPDETQHQLQTCNSSHVIRKRARGLTCDFVDGRLSAAQSRAGCDLNALPHERGRRHGLADEGNGSGLLC